jgi:hypothetical protein
MWQQLETNCLCLTHTFSSSISSNVLPSQLAHTTAPSG